MCINNFGISYQDTATRILTGQDVFLDQMSNLDSLSAATTGIVNSNTLENVTICFFFDFHPTYHFRKYLLPKP